MIKLNELYDNTPLWQMAPYERASLLYVINKIEQNTKNKITAVEIGSYCGGFTKELLKHFDNVFSIDIDHSKIPKNIAYHPCLKQIEGDSSKVLKSVLSIRLVDFILVDGDHSYNGVKNDLEAIAKSLPPTSSPLIFVHDAAYPDSRKALQEFKEKYTKYEVDLNFAPGLPFGETKVGGLAFIYKKQ